MAKKYAVYGFSYINDENGRNTLNGTKGATWDEVGEEYNIACFDGLAYYQSSCGCFIMQYPKFNTLSWEDKCLVERNCGYIPTAGEYGAICSTFGDVKEISPKQFKEVMRDYPIKKSDYQYFDWLNGLLG